MRNVLISLRAFFPTSTTCVYFYFLLHYVAQQLVHPHGKICSFKGFLEFLKISIFRFFSKKCRCISLSVGQENLVPEQLLELQAIPDKLQIKHFNQSSSRAPSVGRSVPTLNQWSEMSPCPQMDDVSHFLSATGCTQRGAFLTFCLPTASCQVNLQTWVLSLGSSLSSI